MYLVICDEAQGYKFDGFVNLYPSVCSIVSEPVVHSHPINYLLASFPGRVGGEKTPLLAQAPLFPVYFRKIVRFTLSFHVNHIRTEYSKSNLRTRSSQKVAAKHFCRIRRSEGRPKYSAALFSDVGLCEDWHSRLCKLLLMSAVSVDSGDGLPAVPA